MYYILKTKMPINFAITNTCFSQVNTGAKSQCLSKEIGVGVAIPCWRRSQLFFYASFSKHLSHPMGKPTICIGENKGADQLLGNREADQRLCFRYLDSTIPPLLNSKISSF